MVNTHTSYQPYYYTQTTDGVNDYNVGINGTNGFVITPFQGRIIMSFNILINFPSTVNSSTTQQRIIEISNSARTSLFFLDIGSSSGSLTNEFIAFGTNHGGVIRIVGVVGAGSISAGWHMLTVSVSSITTFLAIDGVSQSLTSGGSGAPVSVSSGFTANQVSIMGSTSGSVPLGCTWRDAVFISETLDSDDAGFIYGFYTRDGNVSLANSDRSFWRHYVSAIVRPNIIAFYSAQANGTDLLDKVSSASDLTKTNF